MVAPAALDIAECPERRNIALADQPAELTRDIKRILPGNQENIEISFLCGYGQRILLASARQTAASTSAGISMSATAATTRTIRRRRSPCTARTILSSLTAKHASACFSIIHRILETLLLHFRRQGGQIREALRINGKVFVILHVVDIHTYGREKRIFLICSTPVRAGGSAAGTNS